MMADEAMRYLGVDEAELERVVLEHSLDVEVDEAGRVIWVDGDMREVLFAEHHKKVGHRPDDPKAQAATAEELEAFEESGRQRRRARRALLEQRVTNPGG